MSAFGFTFTRPLFLVVGLSVAAVVAAALWIHARRRRKLADFLGGRRAAGRLSRSNLYRTPLERIALLAGAALALAAGAANPTRPGAPPPPEPPVADVILAIDVSMSMQAGDADPNRLARAIGAAEAMLDELEGHRVGLLLFSGTPYPLAPPTSDLDAVRYMFRGITPDLMSIYDPGSLPSAAIREALALLDFELDSATAAPETTASVAPATATTTTSTANPPAADRPRSIVLFTDGEAGEPVDQLLSAVAEAESEGVAVHAVGIGTAEGGGFRPPVGYRPRNVPSDRWDQIVTTIDEEALIAAAGRGNGQYAHVDDGSAVGTLVETLTGPEADPEIDAPGTPWADLDPVSVLAALALLALLAEGLMDVRLPGISVARPRSAP